MQFGIGGSGLAVHRPGVHEIRMFGPVGSRLDMPVLRGRDICVFAPVLVHIIRDTFGDRIASLHAKFASFAERRLYIHHNQSLCHASSLLNGSETTVANRSRDWIIRFIRCVGVAYMHPSHRPSYNLKWHMARRTM